MNSIKRNPVTSGKILGPSAGTLYKELNDAGIRIKLRPEGTIRSDYSQMKIEGASTVDDVEQIKKDFEERIHFHEPKLTCFLKGCNVITDFLDFISSHHEVDYEFKELLEKCRDQINQKLEKLS